MVVILSSVAGTESPWTLSARCWDMESAVVDVGLLSVGNVILTTKRSVVDGETPKRLYASAI